jgi:hypothetical protein
MRWGLEESNPRRPSQDVTGPRFYLRQLREGAVHNLSYDIHTQSSEYNQLLIISELITIRF